MDKGKAKGTIKNGRSLPPAVFNFAFLIFH